MLKVNELRNCWFSNKFMVIGKPCEPFTDNMVYNYVK